MSGFDSQVTHENAPWYRSPFVGLMLLFGNFSMAISKQEGDILFLINKNVPFSDIQLLKFEKLEE